MPSPVESDNISLLTAWRVTAPPNGRRAIFAHLLASDGKIIAQWDGLDVAAEGLQVGDTFIQMVSIPLPVGTPADKYRIQVGVYNPETLVRLSVLLQGSPITDRILLDTISLEEKQ
jgi:hypothetical protein